MGGMGGRGQVTFIIYVVFTFPLPLPPLLCHTHLRAILATASEDSTVRLWGRSNKLKRDTGELEKMADC